MRSIYKYKIAIDTEKLSLDAPVVRFLSAQVQRSQICIWAEIDTEKPDRHFMFAPIGTGWDLSEFPHFDKMAYLDTVQQYGGDLVWHLYYLELIEPLNKLKGQK